MKIIDEKENTDRILSRIQCLRDKNEGTLDRIEEIQFLSDYCCNPDGITLDGDFITLGGEILTIND